MYQFCTVNQKGIFVITDCTGTKPRPMPVTATGFTLRELATMAEMKASYTLLLQLNPKMEATAYENMLQQMIPHNYKQVGVYKADQLVGLSGYWINTKLYCGKYIEMDNVIVDEAYRSHGIGKLLSNWILEKALAEDCKSIHLDAYAHNKKAHRFYFREGFMIEGFHMIRHL